MSIGFAALTVTEHNDSIVRTVMFMTLFVLPFSTANEGSGKFSKRNIVDVCLEDEDIRYEILRYHFAQKERYEIPHDKA